VRHEGNQPELDDLRQGIDNRVVGNQAGEFDQDVPGPGERDLASRRHGSRDGAIHHDLGTAMQTRHLRRLRLECLERTVMCERRSGFRPAGEQVRCETDVRNTLLSHVEEHSDRLLDRARAVVNGGK
jgi:hypothetical protein